MQECIASYNENRLSPRWRNPAGVNAYLRSERESSTKAPLGLLDISKGGARFSSGQRLRIGYQLWMELEMDEEISKIKGTIVWNQISDNNKEVFVHGCRFEETESNANQALNRYLGMQGKYALAALEALKNGSTNSELLRDNVRNFFEKDVVGYVRDLQYFEKEIRAGRQSSQYDVYKIDDISCGIVKIAATLEANMATPQVARKCKDLFRNIVGEWVYQSEIMKHAWKKPRGYPGDHLLIETIYDNEPKSQYLGYCFDRCFLSNPYAIAVRNRKDWMKEILKAFWNSKAPTKDSISILNIGCGSCREVKEALQEQAPRQHVDFTGYDMDDEALRYSRDALEKVAGMNISLDFINKNVLEIAKGKQIADVSSGFDLVYSIGLADYLPNRVLTGMIKYSYKALKPGGELIIAHKDIEAYKPKIHDWLCDWQFIARTKEDVGSLFEKAGIEQGRLKYEHEETQHIFFVRVKKSQTE